MGDRITTRQIKELLKRDDGGLIDRHFLQLFLDHPGLMFTGDLTDVIFTVDVDYRNSLKQMINVGKYAGPVEGIITEEDFPPAFPPESNGLMTFDLQLVRFGEIVRSSEAGERIRENDLRPATLAELLAFGAKYPLVQKYVRVVALGAQSVKPVWGSNRTVFLSQNNSERVIVLGFTDAPWTDDFLFLAVKTEYWLEKVKYE